MTFINPEFVLLRSHNWFDALDDEALQQLQKASRYLQFCAGETLLCEGYAAHSCLLIHEGHIQGLRYTADGDEKIFGQAGPNGMVSVLSVFLDDPRHMYEVRSTTDGSGFLLDGKTLKNLCQTHAVFACKILQHGAELARHNMDQIDWITSSTAEERLAEYIMRFGKPVTSGPVFLPLTHNQIAVKLGMRPETLSRILSKWRQCAYIENKKNSLHILNVDYLKTLAKAKDRISL